jgi:DNA polymerase III delta prime subunit
MDKYTIDKNSKYFTKKYFPTKISQLHVNETKLNIFTNWLAKYNENSKKFKYKKKRVRLQILDSNIDDDAQITTSPVLVTSAQQNKNSFYDKSCLIISGGHGVGKSAFVLTVLNEKGYDIDIVNFEKINQIKNITDFIEKTLRGVDIYSTIIGKSNKKPKVIIIDNVESISSPTEKQFIINLLKINDINWYCPIIFICNNKHNKIINLIKKISFEIIIPPPSNEILANVSYKICSKENIKFESEEIFNTVIDFAKKDFRLQITNLQTIKELYPNKIFSQFELANFIQTKKMKDQDLGIFESTRKLLYSYDNIDDIIKIFETEKIIIPLMIQQHYIDKLSSKNFDKILSISNALSKGDIIENYIYENNIYDIRDTQAFFQCVYPSYFLTKVLNPKKLNLDYFNHSFSFPLDLNKTSIKHINYTKNIIPSNSYFKNMNLNDFIYLNKILKGVIEIENYNAINELIDGYQCELPIIESVLKINKLNHTKFLLSTKIKKKIIKNCNIVSSELIV